MEDNQKLLAQNFYKEALTLLIESGVPFLLGGAYAIREYTGILRETKDLDIFCKSSDFPKILMLFAEKGFKTEIRDIRWLAKIFKDEQYIDLIFDTVNNICTVDNSWYEHSTNGELLGISVQYIAPEELLWCKIYVQNRERFDGADINHLILKKGKEINWERVLGHMEQHWHLLLSVLINFLFVYPTERDTVPKWLIEELISRVKDQYQLPVPTEKVCRGPIIDQTQYKIDITEWNYKVITMVTI